MCSGKHFLVWSKVWSTAGVYPKTLDNAEKGLPASLFRKLVKYGCKKFYDIDPGVNVVKLFSALICECSI
jgi:hypothetical protein